MLEKSQNPADFKIQVMNLSTLNWMQKHLYMRILPDISPIKH
jgi:hypothetical protein